MTENKDWLFVEDNKIYNFRSSGVLVHDNQLLIQRGETDEEYALPGGQVKFGETSAETVVREYKEEMGIDVEAGRLIWVEEVFWKWGEKNCHTICFYHILQLKQQTQIQLGKAFKSLETDASRLLFQWVDIDDVKDYKIYPTFLKDRIANISDEVEHFISKEEGL